MQAVSDRIGREFIATAEDDTILHTMFDLEQYLGQRIDWVVGDTFETVARHRGGWLPNKLHRYCTVEMKIKPMFDWWRNHCLIGEGEPVNMQIGFRHGEQRRALKMIDRCNADGLLEEKTIIGKHSNGNNKWHHMPWQRPSFPMINDGIRRDDVVEFWKGKPVRFAERNNCVGCFHRGPMLLRLMADKHPEKMQWFADIEQEKLKGLNEKSKGLNVQPDEYGRVNGRYQGGWRSDVTYKEILKHKMQASLSFDDFEECDSGHCGL